MKRKIHSICLMLALVICMICFNTSALAAETTVDGEKIYSYTEIMEDGTYFVDEIYENSFSENGNIELASTSKKKTATRTYTYYDKTNKKCWELILKATFQYDGSSSKAIAASATDTIFVNSWKCASKKATYSGNVAKGTGAFKKLLATINVDMGLKCSASGTISKVNY